MTLLAIESATDVVGVALIRDDSGEAERTHVGGRMHAELLAPFIEEVCVVSGCALGDIDAIAVDVGPGLFTGLRVGVATAKALAQALGLGVLGVSSLDVLAAAAHRHSGVDGARRVVSVVDARRGEVFAAAYLFDRDREAAGPIDPASVRDDRLEPIVPQVLVDWLLGMVDETGPVVVVGDGAVRYRPLLSVHPSIELDLAGELSSPPPLALARLAVERLGRGGFALPPEALLPDYRRQADARINWEERAPRVTAPGAPGAPDHRRA